MSGSQTPTRSDRLCAPPAPCPQEPAAEPQREAARLEAEIARLRRALETNAILDQAVGVLVAAGRLTPEQGWEELRETSRRLGIELRDLAERVVAWGGNGQLPTGLRARPGADTQGHAPDPACGGGAAR
ncbi:ANTAR domain-containing protein [Streptomyces sp. p1417]|uniref:ANTAR domain-containing protein n=1 Tax=Streptomyces typhae TaxID=2681492 RepID=A0A6L6X3Y5_9ACTN|nr:ANTAR domain-containing protein [Streptomyces typhae]